MEKSNRALSDAKENELKGNVIFYDEDDVSESYDEFIFLDDYMHYLDKNKQKKISILEDSCPFTDNNSSITEDVSMFYNKDNDDNSSCCDVVDIYINEEHKYPCSDTESETLCCEKSVENDVPQERNKNKTENKDSKNEIEIAKKVLCASNNDNIEEKISSDKEIQPKEKQIKKLKMKKGDLKSSASTMLIPLKLNDKNKKFNKSSGILKIKDENIKTDKSIIRKVESSNVMNKSTRINKIVVDKVIDVNLETNRQKRTNVIKSSYKKDIFLGGKDKLKTSTEYIESPFEESYTKKTPAMRTFDLIREAERRNIIQQNKRTENDIPLRRFIIETEEVSINIDDIFKLNDLKTKSILGMLEKKGTNGSYQTNWFLLRGSFFTCFNGRKYKIDVGNVPNDRLGDIKHPENSNYFLTKKYSIDLTNSRIMMSKKLLVTSIFSCSGENIPAEADLVDITRVNIKHIHKTSWGYTLKLSKNQISTELNTNCLHFIIRSRDGYRFYKVKDDITFLKWIIAFKFRLGLINFSIG